MRKKLYPLLALLFGVAGFALRIRQLTLARAPKTHMLLPHHPATCALIALTAGALLVLVICSATLSRQAQDWCSSFQSESGLLRTLSAIGAAGFGAAALLLCQELIAAGLPSSLRENPFQAVFVILLLVSCAAALSLIRWNGRKGALSLSPVLPGFTSCIWLVLTYHSNASNPSVLAYIWQILAVIAACFAWYYTAGFAFQRPRPRRTVFFHLAASFLCITAIADQVALSQRILLAATALWFLTRAAVLIDNTRFTGKREDP